MTHAVRAGIGVVAALFLVVATATSAWAATWDMLSTTSAGGKLETYGNINFTGNRAFNWSGSMKDICPGDGRGGSIYFELGTPGLNDLSGYKLVNTGGCGTTVTGANNISRNETITQTRVHVCETNNGNPCFLVIDSGAWKDNPNV